VPYAWQDIGEYLSIPSRRSQRLEENYMSVSSTIDLFSNLDSLTLDGEKINFVTRLKLTGKNVIGSIIFPDATPVELEYFLQANMIIFTKKQKEHIRKLALEAENNKNLKIQVSGNTTI
jgi:hypothetical protein